MMDQERQVARRFIKKVKMFVEDNSDREKIWQSLKTYQQTTNLQSLIANLKTVLDKPHRLVLYEEIRPLIPARHQLEYDSLIPKLASDRLRVVRLSNQPGRSLGFCIRGGLEHNIGIHVSDVTPDSQAFLKGLQPGDEIVRVNGFTLENATHDEVLALLKNKKNLILKIKRVGIIPVKNRNHDPITWERVKLHHNKVNKTLTEEDDHIKKVFVNLVGSTTLGCSVASRRISPDQTPGVYINTVKEGSLAEKLGIKPGNQIMEVNGVSFKDITHSQATMILRSSKQLTITLRTDQEEETIEEAPSSKEDSISFLSLNKDEVNAQKAELRKLRELAIQKERERLRKREAKLREEQGLDSGRLDVGASSADLKPSGELDSGNVKDLWAQQREQLEELMDMGDNDVFSSLAGSVPQNPRKIDPYRLFSTNLTEGRELRVINISKDIGSLDIRVEGGADSPLEGKIIVADVFEGGAAWREGGLVKGDQILMVDGQKMVGLLKLDEFEKLLKKEMEDKTEFETLELVVGMPQPKNYEDEVTFF